MTISIKAPGIKAFRIKAFLAAATLAIASMISFAATEAEARGGRGGGGGGAFRGSAGPGPVSGGRSFAPMVRDHGAGHSRSIQPRGGGYGASSPGHRGRVETGPRPSLHHAPGGTVVRDHRGQPQVQRPAPRVHYIHPGHGGRLPNYQVRDHRTNPSGSWRPAGGRPSHGGPTTPPTRPGRGWQR